jgi:hypothetical protein
MNRTRRRIIALAAAYVMGLQALLLPLSVAVGGLAAGTLCTSSGSAAGSQGPAGRSDTSCPCAAGCGMQCCAHVLAGPPHAVIALGLSAAGDLLPAPAIDAAPRPAWHGPQLARAPPAA